MATEHATSSTSRHSVEDAELLDFFDHIDIYVQLRENEWEVRVATQRQSKHGGPNNHYIRGRVPLGELLDAVVPMLHKFRAEGKALGIDRELPAGWDGHTNG